MKIKSSKIKSLEEKYLPSAPCSCNVCVAFCNRPGWWTVNEAEQAIGSGIAERMMLEISPELNFAVLAPAFKGCESNIAMQIYSGNGCTFLKDNLCELHDSELLPLECAYCHHSRLGQGKICHSDLERDWNTREGQHLVARWCELTKIWIKNPYAAVLLNQLQQK